MSKIILTEEQKEKQREATRRWRERHPDYYQKTRNKILEKKKQYYQEHKDEIRTKQKIYRNTPIGRARILLGEYNFSDRLYNRGEGNLTAEWIVENIFSQVCVYCGETDWKKLGCDRLNNSKPHTIDNVVCCCGECNKKKQETNRNDLGQFVS